MAVLEENARSYDKHQKDLTAIQSTGLSSANAPWGDRFRACRPRSRLQRRRPRPTPCSGFNVGEGERLSSRITGSLVNAIRAIDGSKIRAPTRKASGSARRHARERRKATRRRARLPALEDLPHNEPRVLGGLPERVGRAPTGGARGSKGSSKRPPNSERKRSGRPRTSKRSGSREVLANIAIESAKQAAFQVAEGSGTSPVQLRSRGPELRRGRGLRSDRRRVGGAAFAISQSRGMTSSERENLEAWKRRDKAKEKRESANSRSSDGAGGTVVNVFNLGITGQTRTAQARELVKIQQDYGALQIGGPNFEGRNRVDSSPRSTGLELSRAEQPIPVRYSGSPTTRTWRRSSRTTARRPSRGRAHGLELGPSCSRWTVSLDPCSRLALDLRELRLRVVVGELPSSIANEHPASIPGSTSSSGNRIDSPFQIANAFYPPSRSRTTRATRRNGRPTGSRSPCRGRRRGSSRPSS